MEQTYLLNQSKQHVDYLCNVIQERRVGGEGNRKATTYFKNLVHQQGWQVEETELVVMDWQSNGATLSCEGLFFEVESSPYSLGCEIEGELIAVNSLEMLKKTEIKGKIIFLYGEIAAEQISPKNFVFYNPDHHQELIAILENGDPIALVCVTERNSAIAGGVYPFPLFEDGDFDIPSVFMKDTEGEKLLPYNHKMVKLMSKATRIPSTAFNVVARKGDLSAPKIVISAHIDAKIGTPGAIDNATGVSVLLLLSELLKEYKGKYLLELVAFNGEDYYSVPGQMKYIEQHEGNFDKVLLNINIDGAGYKSGISAFSPFDLPQEIQMIFNHVIQEHKNIELGEPWVQGDHSIFVQFGRPAIAVTSSWFIENMECQDITHTPKDNLGIVNFERLPEIAIAITDLVNLIR
ncbi:MAG TPA: M28 family peptidase [Bacteroidales bacterium]|nr:M28 family peptidase [Bacteroidales bacterium]HPS71324.1 M28 family peptidase [Bacteroidales bacterium]